MNGWDDYVTFVLSSESISTTPDELSASELGTTESFILDDILKHVDQLVCDPDDVSFFEIEAGENHLIDDIREHFRIEIEESDLLLEGMKAVFLKVDLEENYLVEDIRSYFANYVEDNKVLEDIKYLFGTYSEENSVVKDCKVEELVTFDESPGGKQLPNKHMEISIALSVEENGSRTLMLEERKLSEVYLPFHSKKCTSNDSKKGKEMYTDESWRSDEHVENISTRFITEIENILLEETDSTDSSSSTPLNVIVFKQTDEDPYFSFKAKLPSKLKISPFIFISVSKEAVDFQKCIVSYSTPFDPTISRQLVKESRHSLIAKYPLERKVSSPASSKIIYSKESSEISCHSFLADNLQFDWEKWVEDEDELLRLSTARVLKHHRRKNIFNLSFLCLYFPTIVLLFYLLYCLLD